MKYVFPYLGVGMEDKEEWLYQYLILTERWGGWAESRRYECGVSTYIS